MKICELRFKNLNSLYGEWRINFQEYDATSLFALTGPTGAGKSTILDAMCLALYGATPRLGKISKTSNEIMSRHTGDCYAEVTFETQSGRFTCHWSQHRARRKADGKLSDAKHEISDAITGTLLESKKRDVALVIEEKTGMDFDRFTRSVLLAQGQFDAFLKADIEQKSKLLEQITGTEIYTEISKKVHEKQKEEYDVLQSLHAEISGIHLLTDDEETRLNDQYTHLKKDEALYKTTLDDLTKGLSWLASIEALQQELLKIVEEEEALCKRTSIFESQKTLLIRAQKADQLEGKYAHLLLLRKEYAQDQSDIERIEKEIPMLEKIYQEKSHLFKQAEMSTRAAIEKHQKELSFIHTVKLLDQKCIDKRMRIETLVKEYQIESTQLQDIHVSLRALKEREVVCSKESMSIASYLTDHAQDEILVSDYDGIQLQLIHLNESRTKFSKNMASITALQTQCREQHNRYAEHVKTIAGSKLKLDTLKVEIQRAKTELDSLLSGRLLREYHTEKESLLREMAFVRKIYTLESERNALVSSHPCPLCGSLSHPYATEELPEESVIEKKIMYLSQLIEKIEQKKDYIKTCEETEKDVLSSYLELEKSGVNLKHKLSQDEDRLATLQLQVKEEEASIADLVSVLNKRLNPLGEHLSDTGHHLVESLKIRRQLWIENQKKVTDIEQERLRLKQQYEKEQAVYELQVKTLASKQQGKDDLKKEYEILVEERKKIFGTQDTDAYLASLEAEIRKFKMVEDQLKEEYELIRNKYDSTQMTLRSIKERIKRIQTDLMSTEHDFKVALTTVEFDNESSFLNARLSKEKKELLTLEAKQIEMMGVSLDARKRDRHLKLEEEFNKKITTLSKETSLEKSTYYQRLLQDNQRIVTEIEFSLKNNEALKKKIKEKLYSIEAQKKEYHKWTRLHELIGSADGKKYRNFAQGLTFEVMVAHANHQLSHMTDRYQLIRHDLDPLELNVMDHFQAGEIRSVKNLSGGESFIVSLSLALGLSKMASRRVRVDSLFLDEGFGTLDEDALELALDALSRLQHDGKLIGIISHVTALKERIHTQISVIPTTGGKSELFGPGIFKINNN